MKREISLSGYNILLFHVVSHSASFNTACGIKKTPKIYYLTFDLVNYEHFLAATWVCKKCLEKLK